MRMIRSTPLAADPSSLIVGYRLQEISSQRSLSAKPHGILMLLLMDRIQMLDCMHMHMKH